MREIEERMMPDMLHRDWFGEDLEPDDEEGSNIDLGDIGRLGGGGGGGNQGNESGGGGSDD
jgi:hypothetical protein